jgi:hypothetical protein
MGSRFLLALALLALPLATNGAGDNALDRATLHGLKSIGVVIDTIDPELEKQGITQKALQSRLIDRLLRGNIAVTPAAAEFVGVRVTSVRGNRGLIGTRPPFAVAVNLGLYQPVVLVRDKNMKTSTQTWEVESVLMAEPKILYQASMETVDELADRFIAAYRSQSGAKK